MDNSIGIGDLAALVTVTGITIYVLGLIGLAIPISRVFTGSLSTAWYAVSLAPRTVVAAQGVRIWIFWTSLNAGVLLLMLLVFSPGLLIYAATVSFLMMFPSIIDAIRRRKKAKTLETSREAAASVASWTFRRRVRAIFPWMFWNMPLLISPIIGLVIAAYAYFLTDPEYRVRAEEATAWSPVWVYSKLTASIFPQGVDSYLVGSLLVLLLASFFFAVPTAISADPPLPSVQITEQPQAKIEGVRDPVEGWLVGHSEGFWHLFDEKNELLSIPDGQVLAVRIAGRADTSQAEAKKPSGDEAK